MAFPPDLLAQAHRLLISGRAGEARPLLEKLAAQPDCSLGVLRQLAELDILDGEGQRAMERLKLLPRADHEAEFLRARAQVVLGQHEGAKRVLLELRPRLATPSVVLELHLASVHERLGESDEAIGALRRAIALKPDTLAAYKNLAVLLAARGLHGEVRDVLRDAVGIAPADAGLRIRLALAQSTVGDSVAALESVARAAERNPTAEQWHQIGQIHAEYWRYEEADAALRQAAAIRPGVAAVASLHAAVKGELGDCQGALATLDEALARAPDDLNLVLAQNLMLPQVYASAQDATAWRARYATGLERLTQETGRWLEHADSVFEVNHNNFLLAYQGEDDRELQRGYSGFLAALAAKARPEWRAGRDITFDGSRRLRVGFVANIFRECTAGRYFERWVTGLDAKRFERFVYHTSPLADEFTARIAASSEHFIPSRLGTRETVARIFADRLDVIVYPEVGMAPLTYLLAALRLAPVQLAGWGHPVTTGSDAIDGFITCAAMEPADAARHYAEPLVLLPGLGVDYSMPAVEPPLPRSKLGLPEDRRLYICPQSLFKIHPEMDELFADVLEGDPGGLLLFFQSSARAVTDQLARRLQATLARRGIPPRGQVKFLPRMSGSFFRRMLGACDVMLDTARWSGGNTSLDALAAGVPVVTLPGRFMRGRQSAAMLGMLGLDELVAATPGDYVRIAVEVASDGARNARLRQAIAQRRGELFDRREPVEVFSEALLRMGAGGKP
jgi:predicted O-linked N-acetylglucosamine transferase (SPINDLY family)